METAQTITNVRKVEMYESKLLNCGHFFHFDTTEKNIRVRWNLLTRGINPQIPSLDPLIRAMFSFLSFSQDHNWYVRTVTHFSEFLYKYTWWSFKKTFVLWQGGGGGGGGIHLVTRQSLPYTKIGTLFLVK